MRRTVALFTLLALSALAARSGAAAAGAAPSAVADPVDDLLATEEAPRPGGYDGVLAAGTASERLALGIALRAEGGRTNLVRAARLFGLAAQAGDSDAQYWLARMYEAGEGMRRPNPEKAVYWAWTGMEATNSACMNLLGTFYERGIGMERDEAAAADCYRRAADLGNAKGALNYALACEYGRGVPPDPALALAYYESASRAGLAEAMFRAGLCHLYGTGTRRDGRAAAEWFLRGARAGDPDSAGFLGRCLVRGMGVPSDPAAAIPWLEDALAAGRADFRADLVRAMRDAGPDPALRDRLVALLETAAGGDASARAAEIADLLSDPGWGPPDLAAASSWLRRGGSEARAAAPAARQRVARASFDAAAVRAESGTHAKETLVLGGLRLGMPAEDAARLLESELAAAGTPRELIVRPSGDGGVRAECDLAGIVGGAGEGHPLRELRLSRAAVDALFGTKGRRVEDVRLAVVGSADVLARSEAREGDSAVLWADRRIGTQRRIVYASPEGWELVFHGPLAVFDNRSIDPARSAGAFLPAGSFTLRRAGSRQP